jgi:nucleoid DNA-binding protein
MGLSKIDKVKLVKEIAEELDLPYSSVRAVIDEIFSATSRFLEAPYQFNKPALFLRRFGTFDPVMRKVAKKAFKAEKNREDWMIYKDLVGDYINNKNSKNKVKARDEQEKKKQLNNSESGDNRKEQEL